MDNHPFSNEPQGRTSPFLSSVVVILTLTAAAKLIGAAGRAPLLALPDPVFGISNKATILSAAGLEMFLVAVVIARWKDPVTYLALMWFGAILLIYRVAHAAVAPGRLCPCLGTLTERIGLSPEAANYALLSVLLYILAGSILAWLRSTGESRIALES